MEALIRTLDDATALRILDMFARARLPASDSGPQLPADVRQALGVWSETPSPSGQASSAGELARQTLLVLASDPQNQAGLTALMQNAAPQRLDFGTSVAVGVIALTVLQTHIKFERGKDGKIAFKIEKKDAPVALLKTLAEKLFKFM